MTKYEKLKRAVAKLPVAIKGRTDYRSRYRTGEFPDWFPSDPAQAAATRDEFKENGGWPGFLGKTQYSAKYRTFDAAACSARRLGLATKQGYTERHGEDSMLPRSPEKYYEDEWEGWRHFLTGYKFYDDSPRGMTEAKKSVESLEITTSREYDQEYIHDPRLPSNPESYFKDWKGWDWFLA